MNLIGIPRQVLGQGHSFRHGQFLIWISETQGLSVARLWASILSSQATSKWIDLQKILQERFEELYLNFVKSLGEDETDVMFDKMPDNTQAINKSNYRQDQKTSFRNRVTWDVIEIDGVPTGEAEAERLDLTDNTQPNQPLDPPTSFGTYEDIVQFWENVEKCSVSASPER